MRKFRTVFLFELKSYLKNKVIVGITLFLILAAAVLLSFPRLSNSGGPGPKQENTTEKPVMMILPDREEEAGRLRNVFAAAFPDYDVRETDLPAETIREQIWVFPSSERSCRSFSPIMFFASFRTNVIRKGKESRSPKGEV